MSRARFAAATAVAALALAGSAPAAHAATAYCSPTGDYCYSASRYAPVKLKIALAARYFERYRLCVAGPRGGRDCKRFRVRRGDRGAWAGRVRWARHFPNRGHGTYRVRWYALGGRLGPGVTFTR